MGIREFLSSRLSELDDERMDYIAGMVEDLSIPDQQDARTLFETIGPFLMDSEYAEEENILDVCEGMAKELGGGLGVTLARTGTDSTPALLSTPLRIIEKTGAPLPSAKIKPPEFSTEPSIKLAPVTMASEANEQPRKRNRKSKKVSVEIERQLQEEANVQESVRQEMAAARMAAILARRKASRHASVGVRLDRLSIPHAANTCDIISDVTLSLNMNRVYGLIGKNGSGKSTLLRALAGYKIPDLQHLSIYLVEQSVEGNKDSAKDWVLQADVERTALIEEEAILSQYLHSPDAASLPLELKGVSLEVALTECYERMEAIGVDSAEGRAVRVLSGLGFDERMMNMPTERLSGGWAMRAALAAALYMRPDLLLLDEPTNHLDLHAILWLENWLKSEFLGISIVVSHDHSFLSDICTDVLELKAKTSRYNGAISHFSGDFESYQLSVAERKIAAARERDALEIKREKLQNFIGKEGKKMDYQNQKKSKVKKLESLAKQAQEIEEFDEDTHIDIIIPSPSNVFDPFEKLVRVENVSFTFDEEQQLAPSVLFENVDMCILPNARICICGKNGSGKTSLLDVICGDVSPTSGVVKWHQGSTLTRLQQHHYRGDQLDRDISPLDHLRRLPFSEKTAIGLYDPGTRYEEKLHRGYLSNFGLFGPLSLVPTKYLSGSQKMRVALAIAMYNRPDVVVLDEPTNHLDGDSIYALCEALQTYTGAVVFVSHDETFINRVLNREGRPPLSSLSASGGEAPISAFPGLEGVPVGELWVLSEQRFHRFEGSFTEYKKIVSKKTRSV